jgi:hypothetical protein
MGDAEGGRLMIIACQGRGVRGRDDSIITADDGGVLCVGARVDLHGTAAAWTLGVGCSSRNSSKVCYGGILPSYCG